MVQVLVMGLTKRARPKRGKYKRYVHDRTVPMPRSTFYKRRKKLGMVEARKKREESATSSSDGGFPLSPSTSQLAPKESLISIMALAQQHGINKTALGDIIQVINMHLPEDERPSHLQSLYMYQKGKEVKFINFLYFL